MPHSKPPRRVDDPPEINMAPVRAENTDIWARAQTAYDHYKLAWAFWAVFAAGAGWIGVHILEPLEAVPKLQAQVARQDTTQKANFDTVKARLDDAEASRKDIVQVLKVFGKFICKSMTEDERYQYDIDCRALPRPTLKPTVGGI